MALINISIFSLKFTIKVGGSFLNVSMENNRFKHNLFFPIHMVQGQKHVLKTLWKWNRIPT